MLKNGPKCSQMLTNAPNMIQNGHKWSTWSKCSTMLKNAPKKVPYGPKCFQMILLAINASNCYCLTFFFLRFVPSFHRKPESEHTNLHVESFCFFLTHEYITFVILDISKKLPRNLARLYLKSAMA